MTDLVKGTASEVLVTYIVVLEKLDESKPIPRTPFPRPEDVPQQIKEMKSFGNAKHVIDFVASLGRKNDTRKVKNIFSVNEYGVTYEQEIVFNGVLTLQAKLSSGNEFDI